MPLVAVRFDVAGERQVSRAFEAYAHEVLDMSEPLDRMADHILAAVRAQFTTQGASGLGEPWERLDEAYEAWKRAHFGPKPILVRAGGTKGAVLNKRQAVRVTRDRMVYEPKGKAAWIAGLHQGGNAETGLPERKIVALTEAQKRAAIDREFTSWLNGVRHQTMGAR